MKVFLICPVRNVDAKTSDRIRAYVLGLEAQGHSVHWPSRDTNQDDPVGLRICKDNGFAMAQSDEVHVWYEATSVGSVFDLGMLFMLREVMGEYRRVVVANRGDVVTTDHKSFPNVLLAISSEV